jgi:hypothetical protein
MTKEARNQQAAEGEVEKEWEDLNAETRRKRRSTEVEAQVECNY